MANLDLIVRRAHYCPQCGGLFAEDEDPDAWPWCDDCDVDFENPPYVLGFSMFLMNPEIEDGGHVFDPDGVVWDWVPDSRLVVVPYT